ncbi:hypothetical protein EUGRSUZ_C01884 [Eucalyptus grandis]|uniref:Uncharacterized protein n=2 Tax=Eucalyptus grandis TaxID=71139 RepID=A0ACC3LE65_EUCGR|nr:hypothetical protein EUGRSUZ_C01884 [Eucalyptus grandis]
MRRRRLRCLRSSSSSRATTSRTSLRAPPMRGPTLTRAATASGSARTGSTMSASHWSSAPPTSGRHNLASLGTCIGKFTKGGSFHLTNPGCWSILAANAEAQGLGSSPLGDVILYGNHVLKGGLGRITENINPGDGVVVFSMSDVPLGFGISQRSTQDCRKLDPNGLVVLHQADIGEYLRMEDEL